MRPGQVFIIPIVQELWIKSLAENNLGRSRPRVWPVAGPRRAEKVSRIGACGTVRVAAVREREGIGAADQCQLPDGVGRHKMGAIEYRTKELSSAYEYS